MNGVDDDYGQTTIESSGKIAFSALLYAKLTWIVECGGRQCAGATMFCRANSIRLVVTPRLGDNHIITFLQFPSTMHLNNFIMRGTEPLFFIHNSHVIFDAPDSTVSKLQMKKFREIRARNVNRLNDIGFATEFGVNANCKRHWHTSTKLNRQTDIGSKCFNAKNIWINSENGSLQHIFHFSCEY